MNKQEKAVLKRLLSGEWVDEKDIETCLNIDTSDSIIFFDHGKIQVKIHRSIT